MVMKKSIYKRAAKSKGKYLVQPRFARRPVALIRNPELKQVDVATNAVVISTTVTATPLNDLVQGVDVCNRIGRSVRNSGLSVRGTISKTGQAIAADYLRVVVVYDRENESAGIAWSDIFQNISAAAATTADAYSFTNSGNWDRFKILKDLKFPMQGAVASSDITDYAHDFNINFHCKLRGLETRYVAGSNNPSTGRILLLTLGTVAVGTAPYGLTFNTRLTYTDS